MTATAQLRQHFEHENQQWKDGDQPRQARVRNAYNAWFRAACKDGNPPDALVRRIGNEAERFMERVIVGLDGHSYWEGNMRGFIRNDGKRRNARLWWWERINGPLGKRDTVKPVCGEPHCITPEHQAVHLWSTAKLQYTDQHCVGALQVAAMRLGHTPTIPEYLGLGLKPSVRVIQMRFSSWTRAIAAAGLPPATAQTGYTRQWTDDDCLDALRAFHEEFGRAPFGIEWSRMKRYPAERTIRDRFGSWRVACVRAGIR